MTILARSRALPSPEPEFNPAVPPQIPAAPALPPRWEIVTAAGRRRAHLHVLLKDHALLRHAWTNAAEVMPGVRRSNNPTHHRLRQLRDQGFRGVLTLRGKGSSPFHLLEAESCRQLGLDLHAVSLSALRAPRPAEFAALFAALRATPRPLLLHCKSGADRTGLAAALLLLSEGRTVAEAREQLAPRFLHLRATKSGILDHILDLYEARLARGPIGIEKWLATEYDPKAAQAGFDAARAGSWLRWWPW